MASQILFHLNKTFKYEAKAENKIGRGTYGAVFRGHFKPFPAKTWRQYGEKWKAAIKRVELYAGKTTDSVIENDREVIALKGLRHPFIVKLLAVEDDDDFRNFVFELCEANLEDFISKKYLGVMPGQIEGLFHMASGLKYIHDNQMIHRDIKPENVLVSISKNGKQARLKIADLGFTKRLEENGTHFNWTSGLKGTIIYMAPELLRLRNQTERNLLISDCKTATDVFATGITFFRYLTGGLHPFGRGFYIEANIMNGEPINLTEGNTIFTWLVDLIKLMVQLDPQNRLSISSVVEELGKKSDHDNQAPFSVLFSSLTQQLYQEKVLIESKNLPQIPNLTVGHVSLEINRSDLIGKGLYGTVFKGRFQRNEVAVKRVQQIDVDENHHMNTMTIFRKLHDDPNASLNVLHLMHYEADLNFRYYVLEFCDVSLPELMANPEKYQNSMLLKDAQVLYQLTSGLHYMHSKEIAHGNIRPDNVLISLKKPVQMKWSGFTSSKQTDALGPCSMTNGVTGMHQNYLAPELINRMWMNDGDVVLMASDWQNEGSMEIDTLIDQIQSDIFSAGCVFLYFLLRGVHPLRSSDGSLHLNKMATDSGEWIESIPDSHSTWHLIIRMVEKDPSKRIQLIDLVQGLESLQINYRLTSMSYSYQNQISKGSYSHIYHLQKFEEMALAVKIVDYIKDFSQEKIEMLKALNHPNVVCIHFFEQDNLTCYFGMELCTTSLDRLYLPDDDPKKYSGPMPTIEEFCFQLASGLHYIHENELVHGSIKPSNILISSITSPNPQIKLSDFGLTLASRRLEESNTSSPRIGGFQGSAFWMAPEQIQALNDQKELTLSKESDIFAAGCVLFYFSSQGCHLYGQDVNKIILNTLAGRRENLSHKLKCIDVFPMGLIRWMTAKEPYNRPNLAEIIRHSELLLPLLQENLEIITEEIKYSRKHVLGSGGEATVFSGYFRGFQVAVKRISNMDAISPEKKITVYRERNNFQKLNHNNIIELYGCAEQGPFLFLALEKCLTTLDAYCRKPLFYRGMIAMPSDCQVLLQMVKGLEFIHQQNIIHRDVKPANILITYVKDDKPAVIKWADFGMSRAVITASRTFTWSNLKGTQSWMAPELIDANEDKKVRGSMKCDIFASGCVFFFFLKDGKHPFGDDEKSAVDNVRKGNRVHLPKLANHFAFNVVKQMTEHHRKSRPKLTAIVDELEKFKETKSAAENAEDIEMEDICTAFEQFRVASTPIPNRFTFGADNTSGERVLLFRGNASQTVNTNVSLSKAKKQKDNQ